MASGNSWVKSMGVASGCGCKEVYRFPHITYPYSSCIRYFLQQYIIQVQCMRTTCSAVHSGLSNGYYNTSSIIIFTNSTHFFTPF